MNSVAIRKATGADAEAALLIRNAAIRAQCASHYPADTLRAWTEGGVSEQFIAEVEARCHVATVNGVVAGIGVVDLQTGKISALFVHPEQMGIGIGTKLMRHMEALAKQACLTRLYLDASLNAAPFYRKCGFVGDQPAKYQSPRGVTLDCIPMTKELEHV